MWFSFISIAVQRFVGSKTLCRRYGLHHLFANTKVVTHLVDRTCQAFEFKQLHSCPRHIIAFAGGHFERFKTPNHMHFDILSIIMTLCHMTDVSESIDDMSMKRFKHLSLPLAKGDLETPIVIGPSIIHNPPFVFRGLES